MSAMKLLLCAVVVVVACIESSAAKGCPDPAKIYPYTKKESCRSDGECKNGMICCLNPARVKSCTYPAPYNGANGGGTAPQRVKCENVLCQPYEVCKADPNNTRRMKCQRA